MYTPEDDPVGRLFQQAPPPGPQREAFLAGLTGLDAAQAEELRRLLAADDREAAGDGLFTGPAAPAATTTASAPLTVSRLLPDPAGVETTRVLLRRRLLYATASGLFLVGVFLVKDLLEGHYASAPGWLLFAHCLSALLFFLSLTGVLAGWRRLREAQLRRLEVLALAGAVLFPACYHLYQLGLLRPYLGSAVPVEQDFVDATTEAIAFRWFILIVGYGIFIPNTPWRFAGILGALAALPVALTVAAGLAGPEPWKVIRLSRDIALWMAPACPIAAGGTIIISRLRRQADEVGAYRIDPGPVGAGGMGIVFRATHRQMLQPCAIKFIHPGRVGDEVSREQFLHEARVMARLAHPHIVQIYNCGEHEGQLYLVTEYLSGLTLQQLVRRHGPLPPGRAVYLLVQACSALAYLHRQGCVHQDVKPSNLFVCEYGGMQDFVKLLDFGISGTPAAGGPSPFAAWGTPGYLAPERLLEPKRPPEPVCDVFSLGATAYFLLAGRGPFDRPGHWEALRAVLDEAPPALPDLPAEDADLGAVVRRCLAKEPAARYQDVGEVEDALHRCRCAGEWGPRQAQEWWQRRGESGPAQ